jgi:hypothetical protein
MRTFIALCIAFALSLVSSTSQARTIVVHFLAAPVVPGTFSPGHAFIVISTTDTAGTNRTGYGFYPADNGDPSLGNRLVRVFSFEAGVLIDDRFRPGEVYVSKEISEDQYTKFTKLIDHWSTDVAQKVGYNTIFNNCMDFTLAAAQAFQKILCTDWRRKTKNSCPKDGFLTHQIRMHGEEV